MNTVIDDPLRMQLTKKKNPLDPDELITEVTNSGGSVTAPAEVLWRDRIVEP